MLPTPDKIQQAIKDAHERRPRIILAIMEIYHAIAQAQRQEDAEEIKNMQRFLYADTTAIYGFLQYH